MKASGTHRKESQAFGSWLEARIRDERMTQAQFAERIGVSNTTVWRWVHGRVPDGQYIEAISDVLVIPYDMVATRAGYRPKELLEVDPDDPSVELHALVDAIDWSQLDSGEYRMTLELLQGTQRRYPRRREA